MSFADDLARFAAKVKARQQAVFVNTASAVKDSIVNGSPLTGAPGQPVDTSNLKNSWQLDFESPTVAVISTNVAYAPVIEHNVRAAYDPRGTTRPPLQPSQRSIKSTVGGHHSLRMTRVGFRRLVDAEVKKVAD